MFLMLCPVLKRIIGDSWALGGSDGAVLIMVTLTFGSFFPLAMGFLCSELIRMNHSGNRRPFSWRVVARIVVLMSLVFILVLAYPVDKELVGTYLAAGDYLRASVRGLFWLSMLGQLVATSHSLVVPDDGNETPPTQFSPVTDYDVNSDKPASDLPVAVATQCDLSDAVVVEDCKV